MSFFIDGRDGQPLLPPRSMHPTDDVLTFILTTGAIIVVTLMGLIGAFSTFRL